MHFWNSEVKDKILTVNNSVRRNRGTTIESGKGAFG